MIIPAGYFILELQGRTIILPNTLTSEGLNFICEALVNPQRPAPLGYIALGTSVPSGGRLGNEIVRKIATYSRPTVSIIVLTADFENVVNVTEIGIFNAETAGVLFAYTTSEAISTSKLRVNYRIEVSSK